MASASPHVREAERTHARRRGRLPPPAGYSESEEEGDDEQAGEIMPKWKLYLVGAAIFLCFALLYPSVLSPMINSTLGRSTQQQPLADQRRSAPPPSRSVPQGGEHGGFRPHMHPSSMHTTPSPGGGGKGGFSWLLPFYTVGVVGFLLYTLSKILFRPKKETKRQSRTGRLDYWEGLEAEEEEDGDEVDAADKETRSMQLRLMKTEEAMKKILDQLEDLAHSTPKGAGNAASESSVQQGDTADKLTPEQVQTMEKGLRELKILSDLCKKQRVATTRRQTSSSASSATGGDSDVSDDCNYQQAEKVAQSQPFGDDGNEYEDCEINSTQQGPTVQGNDGGAGSEDLLSNSETARTVEVKREEPHVGKSKARRRRQRRER